MGVQYLLPCECGRETAVDARQSGLRIQCDCGKAIEVPTHRGLQQLKPAPSQSLAPEKAIARRTWGRRQGLMFLGVSIIILAVAVWVFADRSVPADRYMSVIDTAEAHDLLGMWPVISSGIDISGTPEGALLAVRGEDTRFWKGATYVAAAVGAAVAISSLFVRATPRPAP